MAQELGRVERPLVASLREGRKLFLIPKLQEPPGVEEEGRVILRRYWGQIRSQVASLEERLGPARHVYHESLTEGGDEGLRHLEVADPLNHDFVQEKCQAGAKLEATEDHDVLGEAVDLQRCLMLPFTSNKVATRLQDWFTDVIRRRNEHISKRIDDTLVGDEVGLLVINERHQVQFPTDIEVFFVAPPALDEFRRWLSHWIAQQRLRDYENENSSESSVEA